MLCREISLINHGKIVLQGEVETIREAHKTNLFRVLTRTPLSDYTPVSERKNLYEYTIRKEPSQSNSQLIQQLATQTELVSFEEILPRMNDIFIQTVCNQK